MTAQNQIALGDFRKALGSFTTGVTVVTTRGGGETVEDVGLTANSFNSVSLEPPMVLWSLGKSSLSLPVFKAAEHFAVHILAEDQEDLSTKFATRGVDKFGGLELERGPDSIPLLKRCAARFICKTAYQYEGGDHIIFVGEVLDFAHWQHPPLLFHGGQYGQILKDQGAMAGDKEGDITEASLGYLLRLSAHQILHPLKKELANQGLSIAQYYCLALLAKFNHKPREKLLEMLAYGDSNPSAEELATLEVQGLIDEIDGIVHLSAKGARLHMELAAIYKASESDALEALGYDMSQTLNIALVRLLESTRTDNPGNT